MLTVISTGALYLNLKGRFVTNTEKKKIKNQAIHRKKIIS